MDSFAETMMDFVRTRQLNIAVAGALTLVYLAYEYWGELSKGWMDDDCRRLRFSRSRSRTRRSRSASRSRSRSRAKHKEGKRRRRKRKCPECGVCNQ